MLLHPTSLPGPYGIGDIGPPAHAWVDLLAQSGTGLWQILPLGPTGFADSPYQCFSSFAGNANLVSPEGLVEDGLIDGAEIEGIDAPERVVDYGAVIRWKRGLLRSAFSRLSAGSARHLVTELVAFRERHGWWLEDFALFMAIKEAHGDGPWTEWPTALRLRDRSALRKARQRWHEVIDRWIFIQFVFERQWSALHRYASERGVRIIGDLPLYVAPDSADVWSRPELFRLDEQGHTEVVAGVPPDYFSPTGQLWGNPIYDWGRHRADDFAWWARRLGRTLELTDIVRLDHFRGLADYWEVPAGAPTAELGRWRDGPGMPFFDAVTSRIGRPAIIAEDLGAPSPAVSELLAATALPGMRVLQFAFDSDESNPFLPHNYPQLTVAYTGTHDNDTTLGWWRTAPEEEVDYARAYLGAGEDDPVAAFLDAVWASPAMYALAPLQDLLRLGSEARMNLPATTDGNWQWRVRRDELDGGVRDQLAGLNQRHDRTVSSPSAG